MIEFITENFRVKTKFAFLPKRVFGSENGRVWIWLKYYKIGQSLHRGKWVYNGEPYIKRQRNNVNF